MVVVRRGVAFLLGPARDSTVVYVRRQERLSSVVSKGRPNEDPISNFVGFADTTLPQLPYNTTA